MHIVVANPFLEPLQIQTCAEFSYRFVTDKIVWHAMSLFTPATSRNDSPAGLNVVQHQPVGAGSIATKVCTTLRHVLETIDCPSVFISKWPIVFLQQQTLRDEAYADRMLVTSTCAECMKQRHASQIATAEWLESKGYTSFNYDSGAPLLVNREKYLELLLLCGLQEFDPVSLYANVYRTPSPVPEDILQLLTAGQVRQWLSDPKLAFRLAAVDPRLWPATLDQLLTEHLCRT